MLKFVSEWEMEHSVEAPEALPDYSISVRKAMNWPPNCNFGETSNSQGIASFGIFGWYFGSI